MSQKRKKQPAGIPYSPPPFPDEFQLEWERLVQTNPEYREIDRQVRAAMRRSGHPAAAYLPPEEGS